MPTHAGSDTADSWIQYAQILQTNPEAVSVMDMPRIYLHIARLMGHNSPSDFIRKQQIDPSLMPDADVRQQAEEGNIVRMKNAS